MTLTIIMVFVVPLILWVVARTLHRRHLRRIEHDFQVCECAAIVNRARKMQRAVDTKIAAMDSRDPDKPLPPLPEPPPTEEVKSINQHKGSALISVPAIGLVLAATLLAGMAISGRERQLVRASTIRQPAPVEVESERLAELRDRPTLASVTYFAARGYRGDYEVVIAMRAAAKSSDRNVSRAAQTALLRWGM